MRGFDAGADLLEQRMRARHRNCAFSSEQLIKRFAFDLELLVVANWLGYRKICEAPIRLEYQFESTVNLKSAWNVLWDTAAIFYRLRVLHHYEKQKAILAASNLSDDGVSVRPHR